MSPSQPTTESHKAEESILYLKGRTHRAILLVMVIAGEVGAFWFAPEDWGRIRTVLAGIVVALGSYICLFINRIIVSVADDW